MVRGNVYVCICTMHVGEESSTAEDQRVKPASVEAAFPVNYEFSR